jgi:excisionase family DNA binding protein
MRNLPDIGVSMPTLRQLEDWMTTGDAARRLNKSVEGVKWLLRERRLRGVRTRLGWLIDPASVEEYAKRR